MTVCAIPLHGRDLVMKPKEEELAKGGSRRRGVCRGY